MVISLLFLWNIALIPSAAGFLFSPTKNIPFGVTTTSAGYTDHSRRTLESFTSFQALFSSSSSIATIEASDRTSAPYPPLKRFHETFEWNHVVGNTTKTHKINYRVEGPLDAKPLLLVHGFGANVNHFRYQFAALSKEYRVYAIDLLGFGASDKPKDELYSIELWVDLLVDFIHKISSGVKHPHSWVIAGNSIGGLCSICTAARLPERIRGCVLFNCAGGMTTFRYEEIPLYLHPILWFIQNVIFGDFIGKRVFDNFKTRENVESILRNQGVYGDTTHVNDDLIQILLEPSDDEGAQDVFLKVFRGPAGPTPESVLPTVQCPILALWGDADPWTPPDKGLHPGNQFSNYHHNFTLVLLPNAGHCPHDEVPDLCHKYMVPWMQNLSDKAGGVHSVVDVLDE